ncbi:unnamed protein product, partial [marine sediment metagenome]
MGWLISFDLTKKQQVAELVKGWTIDDTGRGMTCLDYSVRGNTLYAVMQPTQDGKPSDGDAQIAVYRLRKDRGMGWGYKDMSEAGHPFYYDCPLKLLKLAPVVASAEWRANVHAWHARNRAMRSAKIDVGSLVRFRPGLSCLGEPLTTALVVGKTKRGYLVDVGGGMKARVTRRNIEKV